MADKKISELPDGLTLQDQDKILVARGATNVFVRGIQVPTSLNFQPPAAVMFTAPHWTRGATGGALVTNHPRGLLISDQTGDANGIHMAMRPVPQGIIAEFSVTARISFNGVGHQYAGCGIAVSTVANGANGKNAIIGRMYGNGLAANTPYASFIDGSSDNNNPTIAQGPLGFGSEATWFRITIRSTTAIMSFSDDGVLFTDFLTQDFGQPIAYYGLFNCGFANGTSVGLCDYFYSTEIFNDPTIAVTGATAVLDPKQQGHQYWRVNVIETQNPASTFAGIGNLEFHNKIGGPQQALRGTPISSGVNPTRGGADQAFSGGVSSTYPGWASDGSGDSKGWLGYKFPYPINVQEVTLRPMSSGDYDWQGIFPRDYNVDWSDDGVTWTTLLAIRNLPSPQYGQFFPVGVQDGIPSQTVGPAADFGMNKTGCRVALALRKLFPDYNGPLIQVASAYGTFDVFPRADGRLDTDFLLKLANKTGGVKVLTWYDQSGLNNHATPTDPNALPQIVVDGAVISLPNGAAGVRIAQTPMDLPNFGFATGIAGNYMSAPLAMVQQIDNPTIVSNLMSDNGGISIDFVNNTLQYGINRDGTPAPDGLVGDLFDIYTAQLSAVTPPEGGTYAQGTMGINGRTVAKKTLISYFNNVSAANKTRIGQNWNSSRDLMFDGRFGEIVFYDPTAVDTATITKNQGDFFGVVI